MKFHFFRVRRGANRDGNGIPTRLAALIARLPSSSRFSARECGVGTMTAKRLSKFATAIRDNQQVASFIRGEVGRAGPAILSWSLSPSLFTSTLRTLPSDRETRGNEPNARKWFSGGEKATMRNETILERVASALARKTHRKASFPRALAPRDFVLASRDVCVGYVLSRFLCTAKRNFAKFYSTKYA